MHSKFIILAITLRWHIRILPNLVNSCHVYGYICLPSFIDVGIKIAILEQVEVISEFSWKWRIWRAIFSNLVSDRVYNFVYGWKGHIFKYLNPKKGTGLPSHYGDTATERKPIPRTLEGAIYVVQSHWSVKFGMAMCNYEIKILWDLNTKQNLYEKVMAVLDYLGVHFSRIWEIFDGVGFRFEFWVWRWHFEGQVIHRRLKNIS